jgi:hypothetical protein
MLVKMGDSYEFVFRGEEGVNGEERSHIVRCLQYIDILDAGVDTAQEVAEAGIKICVADAFLWIESWLNSFGLEARIARMNVLMSTART